MTAKNGAAAIIDILSPNCGIKDRLYPHAASARARPCPVLHIILFVRKMKIVRRIPLAKWWVYAGNSPDEASKNHDTLPSRRYGGKGFSMERAGCTDRRSVYPIPGKVGSCCREGKSGGWQDLDGKRNYFLTNLPCINIRVIVQDCSIAGIGERPPIMALYSNAPPVKTIISATSRTGTANLRRPLAI